MSKTKNSEKKELELRQQRAETRKAELELEIQQQRTQRATRDHRHDYEYDPEGRGVFHLIGAVDSTSCAYWADRIQRYAHLHPGEPITIHLQTPGGSVLHGLGFYDTLRTIASQGHHITTVVRGFAASMGAVLLQAGDTRLVGTESLVMLHEVSSGTGGKLHEMKDDVKFTEQLNRRLMSIIANRTGEKWTADALYERIEAKDWWLSADEAVDQGFADGVG
jgi:ATP-dependent Clp protease protease subunit